MGESRPKAASVAAPGMLPLFNHDICLFLSCLVIPTVDEIHVSARVPWMDKRKKFLDKLCQVKNKKAGDKVGLEDKVHVDLLTTGNVEDQKEYVGWAPIMKMRRMTMEPACPCEFDEKNPGCVHGAVDLRESNIKLCY